MEEKKKRYFPREGFEFAYGKGINDMCALADELIKYWHGERGGDRIAELMADVYLFLGQLQEIFGNDTEVNGYMADKLEDRRRRIEEKIIKTGCILQSYGEAEEDGRK